MTDQKREAVEVMCEAAGLSQRRACRLAGLSLSTCRYSAQRPAADAQLSLRLTELALERRRFGYRRILATTALGGPSRQPQAGITHLSSQRPERKAQATPQGAGD